MRLQKIVCGIVMVGVSCSLAGEAQEKGSWRAASSTARSITGDLAFSAEKISINYVGFPIAQIRPLTPAELNAAFHAESSPGGSGNLYRVSIPASKAFLRHNTLCGSEDTQWIATYVAGRSLQLAFFSGPEMPLLTAEALANGTSLCGTFSYVR